MYDWDFYLVAVTFIGLLWLVLDVLPKSSQYSRNSKIIITIVLAGLTYLSVSRILFVREMNEFFENNPPLCSHVAPEYREECFNMYYARELPRVESLTTPTIQSIIVPTKETNPASNKAEPLSSIPPNCTDWYDLDKENSLGRVICVYGEFRDGGKIGIRFFDGNVKCGTPSYNSNHSDECNTYMESLVSYDTYYFENPSSFYDGNIIIDNPGETLQEKVRINSYLDGDTCIWITGKLYFDTNWFRKPYEIASYKSKLFVISDITGIGYCTSSP